MPIQAAELPPKPCLLRVDHAGRRSIALWSGHRLQRLGPGLDELLRLTAAEMRVALAKLVAAAMQPSRGAFPQQTRWAKLPPSTSAIEK